jgi:predicted cupin superfamily sugar epimerase
VGQHANKEFIVTADYLMKKLNLEKLPEEGGFYRQVYRSAVTIPALPELDGHPRVQSTDIYYLMTPEEFSGLHVVHTSIEIWNFYLGDAAEMVQIDPAGKLTRHLLGNDFEKGQTPKLIVPAGVWQATRLCDGGTWALVGCTCVPGFEFADFETASEQEINRRFPEHAGELSRYVSAFNRSLQTS